MDRNLRKALAQYAEMGIQVEFLAEPDACPACRALAGKPFDPRSAPEIPVPSCEREFCRCDYLPISN